MSSRPEALLIIVLVAAAGLITINYFTIKILSATRSYANGESWYSKGQKDAARSIIMYINTEEPAYWNTFLEGLSIPIGDSIARAGLTKGADYETIRNGFLAGHNHPDDIDDLVWMFRNFKDISFMKSAIQIWKEADVLVGRELLLGHDVKRKIETLRLTAEDKKAIILEVNALTTELTRMEHNFLTTLGTASRNVRSILLIANVIFTLLIISGTSGYAWLMIHQLRQKNADLTTTNEELDKFVYSASHDLRAPITSMQGLIELIKIQNDPEKVTMYLQFMEQSLRQQDAFIRDIIDFSRNKRTVVSSNRIDLSKLIDDVIQQHMFMEAAQQISIQKEIKSPHILSDELRIRIILNNLVSNAIKYSDPKKGNRMIMIRTRHTDGTILLQVEDNGLGIKPEDQQRVFDMFFVTNHDNKGSGLGLYITQETVQKLNGKISVQSQHGVGTTFNITLPYHAKAL